MFAFFFRRSYFFGKIFFTLMVQDEGGVREIMTFQTCRHPKVIEMMAFANKLAEYLGGHFRFSASLCFVLDALRDAILETPELSDLHPLCKNATVFLRTLASFKIGPLPKVTLFW